MLRRAAALLLLLAQAQAAACTVKLIGACDGGSYYAAAGAPPSVFTLEATPRNGYPSFAATNAKGNKFLLFWSDKFFGSKRWYIATTARLAAGTKMSFYYFASIKSTGPMPPSAGGWRSNCGGYKFATQQFTTTTTCKEPPCDAGTSAPFGTTSKASCKACPAGTYSRAMAASCTKCGFGSYQRAGGKSSCFDCPAGRSTDTVGKTASSSCSACAAGTAPTKSGCTPCLPGNFAAKAGSPLCTACPSFTISNQVKGGSLGCKKCPAGKVSDGGTSQYGGSTCLPVPSSQEIALGKDLAKASPKCLAGLTPSQLASGLCGWRHPTDRKNYVSCVYYAAGATNAAGTYTTKITLNNCGIKAVPASVGAAAGLLWLRVENNMLTGLPIQTNQLALLQILRLGNNQIKSVASIDAALLGMKALTKLSINANQLTVAPTLTNQAPALYSLDFRRNRVTKISPEYGKLTKLRYFEASHNLLMDFPTSIKWPELTGFDVGGNPLSKSKAATFCALEKAATTHTLYTFVVGYMKFDINPTRTDVTPTAPRCTFESTESTCDFELGLRDRLNSKLSYGGNDVTIFIDGQTLSCEDNKDGTYTAKIPMRKLLKKPGTHMATIHLDGVRMVPDPVWTNLANPLPIVALPVVCGDSLMKVDASGLKCELKTCPVPASIKNGARVDPRSKKFNVNSAVTFICNDGFFVKEGATVTTKTAEQMTCKTDGTWEATPECAPVDCIATPNSVFCGVRCDASSGLYAIKSCGSASAASCTPAVPCQLKPEFKAATGGKDLALWGWTCSEDLTSHCVDGKDEWLTMNADGTESGCAVMLTESGPLFALIGAVFVVTYGAVTFFVKTGISSLAGKKSGGTVVTSGTGALLGGLVGFADIVSDWMYLVVLATQRRLATLFWLSCGSLLSSMFVNTIASVLVLKFMTTESPAAKEWLQDGKNRNWAALCVLFSTSRVETLEMLAFHVHGFPMKKSWMEFIAALGILTPIIEDGVQLYVVITASTMLDEWTPFALVNLTFTIVSMLFAVISKVIEGLAKGGDDDAEPETSEMDDMENKRPVTLQAIKADVMCLSQDEKAALKQSL